VISEVAISGIKCFRELRLELGRLTVLVGANGAGKSTVLQCLVQSWRQSAPKAPNWRFVGFPASNFSPFQSSLVISVEGALRGSQVKILSDQFHDTIEIKLKDGSFLTFSRYDEVGFSNSIEERETALGFVRQIAPATRLLSLDPSILRVPSQLQDTNLEIGDRGESLAAVLSLLKTNEDPRFTRVEQDLCAVVPDIKKIRFQPVGTQGDVKLQLIAETVAGSVAAPHMSEGTLYALGLLAVLHTTSAKLILLDDFDRTLHPSAMKTLVECLRRVLDLHPDLQIIATTHSPYLLDWFRPDEIRVFAKDKTGAAHARRLDEHPDFKTLEGLMPAGEIWSHVGEQWVVELADRAASA